MVQFNIVIIFLAHRQYYCQRKSYSVAALEKSHELRYHQVFIYYLCFAVILPDFDSELKLIMYSAELLVK